MKTENIKTLLLLIVIIGICTSYLFGQGPDADSFFNQNRDRLERIDNMTPTIRKSGLKRMTEITKEGKILLTPATEDFAKYKQFLNQSKTGIAKIFPAVKCEKFILNADDSKCIQASQMPGQGAYYSFRKKINIANVWSDIYFAEGEFRIVNDPMSLGFIIDLGDLPIESIDKKSSAVASLQKYQMPKTFSGLKFQKEQLSKNGALGNISVTSKIKAKLNTTYGLRIARWTNSRYDGEDIDFLIVLRVIRENEDGSVTIIWKELSDKKSPKLKLDKVEKLTDAE